MIANPKWFSPRKYSGWGLTPNCWQGWAYLAAAILPIIFISNLNLPGNLPTILMFVWTAVIAVDFIDIMVRTPRDERDTIHEALAERNAMWFMVTALAAGVIYQSSVSTANGTISIDPVILIALFGALAVKAATHWYLRDK